MTNKKYQIRFGKENWSSKMTKGEIQEIIPELEKKGLTDYTIHEITDEGEIKDALKFSNRIHRISLKKYKEIIW